MITLKKVDETTFYKVVDMKLPKDQNRFVAPNVVSLAQAWLYYDNARPFAICNGEETVGFIMLDWDENERTVGIWRFMIAPQFQRKGYGKAAVSAVIDMAKNADNIDFAYLSYVPENEIARKLYYSLGFRENGDMDDDEIVMALRLTDKPKVGLLTADEDDLKDLVAIIRTKREKGGKIPLNMQDEALLKVALLEGRVMRFTLFGETIALSVDGEILADGSYSQYFEEIEEKGKSRP